MRNVHGDDEGTRDTVLEEAARLVYGKRGANYGHPLDNHGATATMFTAYLDRKYKIAVVLDAEDVCWFNILQKCSRDANEPGHDNLVDTAGYAANIQIVRDARNRRAA